MIAVILLGCAFVGLTVYLSILELEPYLFAVKSEIEKATSTKNPFKQWIRYIILPFKLIGLTKLLIPTIVDLVSIYVLGKMFTLGAGLAGGLTGMFASNLISIIIFSKTHKGHVWSSLLAPLKKKKPQLEPTC